MNKIFLAIIGVTVFGVTANAKTILYQCAVDRVGHDGARVNLIEKDGVIRANLIFGTTVSGTIYNVKEMNRGYYAGQIKNKSAFTMELVITDKRARNDNIDGYESSLKATYPTLETSSGYDVVETSLVCGEKISERWK
jgi:hypothetical protein